MTDIELMLIVNKKLGKVQGLMVLLEYTFACNHEAIQLK